jgi:thiol-disulfide isomerase/thioredoxin
MKKNYFKTVAAALGLMSLASTGVNAQLNETFNGLTMTSVTAGTSTVSISTTLPTGWSQLNNDGFAVNSALSYMGTNGWIARRLSLDGVTVNTVAMSISWYASTVTNPTSDDYLITPQFTVPTGAGNYLLWQGVTLDSSYPDGYEVRVSTTGTAAADFSTVIFSTTAENASGWAQHAADLSAFAGQNIYVAFRNNSNDKYVLLIDDIRMQTISNTDAELVSLNVERFSKTNTNLNIAGTIKNNGLPITSLNIEWNDGSGAQTATLTGLNIAPYSTYDFTHTVPFNKNVVNEFNVNVNISSVNGGATESNTNNNSTATKISTIANSAFKYVVIEEGTGTWCGWCPRGAVAMEAIENDANYRNNFIGIAVHNADPMANTAYDNAADFSGFPGCNVDRVLRDQSVTIPLFQQFVGDFKSKATPVAVTATSSLNTTSRVLTVNAAANFRTKISDEVRFAVVLVEDSVHSTAAGYEQVNYYSSTQANQALTGAGHNWQTEPSPVPAASMWYDHVGRELIGGYNGEATSIPATLNDGTNATHTFTYTVPAAYNLNQLKVVVMVVNAATAEIYNAFEMKANGKYLSVNEVASTVDFNVYPNPVSADGKINVTYNLAKSETVNISAYNAAGKLVYSNKVAKSAGVQMAEISTENWSAGSYMVNVTVGNATTSKNITVVK